MLHLALELQCPPWLKRRLISGAVRKGRRGGLLPIALPLTT